MDKIKLKRTGDIDVVFTGVKIGSGEEGSGGSSGYPCDWTRGLDTTIYRTEAGKLVIHRKRWSLWQGESGSNQVDVVDTLDEARALLTENDFGYHYLSAGAKAALEDAAFELEEDLVERIA